MAEFKTKKEWLTEARRLRATGLSAPEVASIVGEFSPKPGQRYSIHNSTKNGVVAVDMEARLARGNKRNWMERSQSLGVGDTVMPRNTTDKTKKAEQGVGPGMELHHRISLIQNTPFYDGLSDSEAREFTSWAVDEGWQIGNMDGNTNIPLQIPDHKSIHAWMRQNGIEGARGPQKSLTEKLAGLPLEQRKNAFRDYMHFVQVGVDEHMQDSLGDVSVSAEHNAAQRRNSEIVQAKYNQAARGNALGTIPSGPKKGQRLPVNRRTLGDSIINDLQFNSGSTNLNINAIMTKANMPALGGFTHHSRTPSVTADQSTYTPPKLQPSQTYTPPNTPVTPKVNRAPSVLENVGAGLNQAMPVLSTGLAIGAGIIKLGFGSLLPGGI